jgi:hypothetical protein
MIRTYTYRTKMAYYFAFHTEILQYFGTCCYGLNIVLPYWYSCWGLTPNEAVLRGVGVCKSLRGIDSFLTAMSSCWHIRPSLFLITAFLSHTPTCLLFHKYRLAHGPQQKASSETVSQTKSIAVFYKLLSNRKRTKTDINQV